MDGETAYSVYSDYIQATGHCIDTGFDPFMDVYTDVYRIMAVIETFAEVTQDDEEQILNWITDLRAEKRI